jgi:amidohydrolase
MLGEDYAEFTKRVPGAFYFVGIANKEKGTDYPHHHPKFDIDEDALLVGAQMHVQSAIDYLGE